MKIVTRTKCSSVKSCAEKVTEGLPDVWEVMKDGVLHKAKGMVEGIHDIVNKGINLVEAKNKDDAGVDVIKVIPDTVYDKMGNVVDHVKGIAGEVMEYMKDHPRNFSKYDIGRVCTSSDMGFWYLYPSDCGAFESMDKLLEIAQTKDGILTAPEHYANAKSRLKQCLNHKGLLDVPMPFLKVGWTHYCLPEPIVTAMEYLIGGNKFAPDLVKPFMDNIGVVVEELKTLGNNLGLMQMAKELHASDGNGASAPALAQEDPCFGRQEWSVAIGIRWGALFASDRGEAAPFGVSTAVVLGCKDGQVMDPNWLLKFDFQRTIQPFKTTSSAHSPSMGLKMTLKFDKGYPAFQKRTKVDVGMVVVPSVNLQVLTGGAIPIPVEVPVEFPLLPDPNAPKAFELFIKTKIGIASAQLVEEAAAASEQASLMALAHGADPALAAVAGGLHALAGRREELRATFAGSLPARREILEQAKVLNQHAETAPAMLLEHAQRRLAGSEKAPGAGLGALQESEAAAAMLSLKGFRTKVAASFCITPGKCFGSE